MIQRDWRDTGGCVLGIVADGIKSKNQMKVNLSIYVFAMCAKCFALFKIVPVEVSQMPTVGVARRNCLKG